MAGCSKSECAARLHAFARRLKENLLNLVGAPKINRIIRMRHSLSNNGTQPKVSNNRRMKVYLFRGPFSGTAVTAVEMGDRMQFRFMSRMRAFKVADLSPESVTRNCQEVTCALNFHLSSPCHA